MTRGTGDRDDGFATMSDGAEIAYQVRGREHDGFPLLLIRPLGGSISLWGTFRALLAEKHRVVAFDLRGSGHSGRETRWVTTRKIARDCRELLDHLQIPRANVFGISLGGMVATWFGILFPERVGKLCIASAPARGIELSRIGLKRELDMGLAFTHRAKEVEPRLIHRLFSDRFRTSNGEDVQRIERLVRAEPATRISLIQHGVAGLLHDARSQLSSIRAPTLVLAGADDTLAGTEAPRRLAAAISGASFEIIPRAGHDLTLEQPIETAERVLRFLET
jgi:3-oxoadipate enol-lactonase